MQIQSHDSNYEYAHLNSMQDILETSIGKTKKLSYFKQLQADNASKMSS